MEEVWKDISGYEGLYQISNYGMVKSLHFGKEKILKPSVNSSGYYRVFLKGNGKSKRPFIHRLVAETFLEKIDNKNVVNHIDNNPKNNKVCNLEWVTQDENMAYMAKQGRSNKKGTWLEKIIESNKKNYVPIIKMNQNNEILKRYEKLTDVKKDGYRPGDVCKCCQGERKTAGGFRWRYYDRNS